MGDRSGMNESMNERNRWPLSEIDQGSFAAAILCLKHMHFYCHGTDFNQHSQKRSDRKHDIDR
jgi:hypothetical protein